MTAPVQRRSADGADYRLMLYSLSLIIRKVNRSAQSCIIALVSLNAYFNESYVLIICLILLMKFEMYYM